jgi:hypothetical protein
MRYLWNATLRGVMLSILGSKLLETGLAHNGQGLAHRI